MSDERQNETDYFKYLPIELFNTKRFQVRYTFGTESTPSASNNYRITFYPDYRAMSERLAFTFFLPRDGKYYAHASTFDNEMATTHCLEGGDCIVLDDALSATLIDGSIDMNIIEFTVEDTKANININGKGYTFTHELLQRALSTDIGPNEGSPAATQEIDRPYPAGAWALLGTAGGFWLLTSIFSQVAGGK